MKKKVLFIINPGAGRGKVKKNFPEIIKKFENMGFNVQTVYTRLDYSPTQILEKYGKDIEIVICCGGDGTLNEVINGIVKLNLNIKTSFIPLGTTNDFAKTIHLCPKKMAELNDINNVEEFVIDVGKFNEKYFNYVAAFGAFTEVSYGTPRKLKKIFGRLAYILEAIRCLTKIKGYKIKVKFNNQEVEDKFIYGAISNSKSVGGFKWFKKKEVELDDGKFEMLLIKEPKNIIKLVKTLISLLSKNYNNSNFVYSKIEKVELESEESIKWTLDGELGGNTNKVTISNINKRIKYMIPK